VTQAVVSAWFSSNLVSLWLLPIALAAAYYLVPKLSGRTLNNYHYAPHGFWTLIFFAAWNGARHLVGGPVPAWIPTLAIVSTALLLFPLSRHRAQPAGGLTGGHAATVLGFISLACWPTCSAGVAGCGCFRSKHFAALIQFHLFPIARSSSRCSCVLVPDLWRALYIVPRITGTALASAGLIRAHFGLSILGWW